MAMPSNQSRILTIVAAAIQNADTVEAVRDLLNLQKMVPEIRLTAARVTKEHFLQWDPRVFMSGNIWHTVSFSGADITNSDIYLFVAVVFLVDNKMREGEPRVWSELLAAWDATFGLAPGELRPNVDARRYGSLLHPADRDGWSGHPLDYALSGERHLLGRVEHTWLQDCLYHYNPMIDSLEKLHDVRDSMVTEGPRWWRTPEHGDVVWMPQRFWGANER
jgi:hypothetical protein